MLSRHTPKILAFLGFLFACGKNPLLQSIQIGHRRFWRACEGDTARSMISMYCASELKRLSSVTRGISRAFSRVENQAGERQCVKRPAGFTADGRADRFFSRFDRISSFFRAYRLEKGSVSSTRIFAKSVCQPYARFRKTGGFFACLRAFPVCQVYTQKNQHLCNQGGSVCIR